mgnify:CR=1 FL=1
MAKSIHRLHDIAEEAGIIVQSAPLPERVEGLYLETPLYRAILLNRDLGDETSAQHCALAEELGHHFTTAGDCLIDTGADPASVGRAEERAKRWAADALIPLPAIAQAFMAGCRTRSEVAEYLSVTEVFLMECVGAYHRRYGKWAVLPGGFAVCFDPFGVLKMQEMGEL